MDLFEWVDSIEDNRLTVVDHEMIIVERLYHYHIILDIGYIDCIGK